MSDYHILKKTPDELLELLTGEMGPMTLLAGDLPVKEDVRDEIIKKLLDKAHYEVGQIVSLSALKILKEKLPPQITAKLALLKEDKKSIYKIADENIDLVVLFIFAHVVKTQKECKIPDSSMEMFLGVNGFPVDIWTIRKHKIMEGIIHSLWDFKDEVSYNKNGDWVFPSVFCKLISSVSWASVEVVVGPSTNANTNESQELQNELKENNPNNEDSSVSSSSEDISPDELFKQACIDKQEFRPRDAQKKFIESAELYYKKYVKSRNDGFGDEEFCDGDGSVIRMKEAYENAIQIARGFQPILNSILAILKIELDFPEKDQDKDLIGVLWNVITSIIVKAKGKEELTNFIKELVSHSKNREYIVHFVSIARTKHVFFATPYQYGNAFEWTLQILESDSTPPSVDDFVTFTEICMLFTNNPPDRAAKYNIDNFQTEKNRYENLLEHFRQKQYGDIIKNLKLDFNFCNPRKDKDSSYHRKVYSYASFILLCGSYYALQQFKEASDLLEKLNKEESDLDSKEQSNLCKVLKARFKEFFSPVTKENEVTSDDLPPEKLLELAQNQEREFSYKDAAKSYIKLGELYHQKYIDLWFSGYDYERLHDLREQVHEAYGSAIRCDPEAQNVINSIFGHMNSEYYSCEKDALHKSDKSQDSEKLPTGSLIVFIIRSLIFAEKTDIVTHFLKRLIALDPQNCQYYLITFSKERFEHYRNHERALPMIEFDEHIKPLYHDKILAFVADILHATQPDPRDFYVFSEIHYVYITRPRSSIDLMELDFCPAPIEDQYSFSSYSQKFKLEHYKDILNELKPKFNHISSSVPFLILLCGCYYALHNHKEAREILDILDTQDSEMAKVIRSRFNELFSERPGKKTSLSFDKFDISQNMKDYYRN